MCDINQLRERIARLETEIDSILAETGKLQHAHRRKFAAWLVFSAVPALLLGAGWSLAQGQGDVVHAPFAVMDGHDHHTIFQVNNDHSFYVYTEDRRRALIGKAGTTVSYFMADPGGGGPWVKLGLEGSTNMAPFLKISSGQSQVNERIVLHVKNGKPELTMRNTGGIQVFDLLEGQAFPGGELGLFSGSGEMAVRAGSSRAGIGRVEAFPLGNPIGSSIVGRVK